MSRSALGWLLVLVPLSTATFACSSDEKGSPSATGGVPGTGGVPATGGAASGGAATTGGATATGGAASGGVASSGGAPSTGGVPYDGTALYVCDKRPPRDPGGTGALAAACCGGKGACATPPATPNPALGHETCGSTLLCQPTDTAAAAFAKCTTKIGIKDPAGAEGRCLPKCFTLGGKQSMILDNGGTCGTDELCMPCFNPVDGKPSGACSLKPSDAPTTPSPSPYEVCPAENDAGFPEGGGLCVPETALTAIAVDTHPYYNPAIPGLQQGSCDTGQKCVPAQKAQDPGYCSPKCTTSSFTQTVGVLPEYKFGACTAPYVIFDVAGATGIQVSTGGGPCPTTDLCAPCLDPLKNGNPSGACY